MPVLPIPVFTALIIGFLGFRALTQKSTSPMILFLIFLCAGQNLIIAGTQFYQIGWLRHVQAITAVIIPPAAFLACVTSAMRPFNITQDWIHILGPMFIAFCMMTAPNFIDLAIIFIFFSYGIGLLMLLYKGEDQFVMIRLDSGALPIIIWRFIALSLIASSISDIAITAAIIYDKSDWVPWIITGVSSMILFFIGFISLSDSLETVPANIEIQSAPPHDPDTDIAVMDKLRQYLDIKKPFLDPDLTLSQLARRMALPTKSLSGAINRTQDQNVSKFINGYRVQYACELLDSGTRITDVVFDCGFQTKSNFNREFLRVMRQPPREWLRDKSDT